MSKRERKDSGPSTAFTEAFSQSSQESRAFWSETGSAYLEKATQYAEMGRFQILLLIVCLIAYSNTSTVPNILNKFSSAIQCDYQLKMKDKEAINDVVYVCMILGGVAWSVLADTLSRKWTLILALLVYTVSTIGLTLANSFLLFGLFRGLSSFCRSGIPCITIAFISEFQISYFRGSMICCLELAWVIGMAAIPALPFSWKSLVLISTIPSTLAMVGVMFFPDSPRFLLSRGREKAAIRSLQMIHAINTGTNKINFPIRHLKDNRTPGEIRRNSIVKAYIPPHMEPKFICIPIIMLIQFTLMFSYYTLALWFPYMVARTEAFFPVTRAEDIPVDCKIGVYHIKEDAFRTGSLSNVEFIEGDDSEIDSIRVTPIDPTRSQPENPCNMDERKHFDRRTSTLTALTSMPSIIWLVLKIDTIGRRFFMILAHIVAGCLAFASYFTHNIGMELLFSCLFDSVTILSVGASHCLAVELFSTRVRVLGVALIIGSGQLGAILADIGGAISFGLTCVVVVALTAIALAFMGKISVNKVTFVIFIKRQYHLLKVPKVFQKLRVRMANPLQSLNENFFYNSMLARALLQLLPANNRPSFRHWLHKLHAIDGSPDQMTIRNDYMWFMLLMLQSKRIAEPFKNDPPQGELRPLNQILPVKVYEDILTSSDQNMAWLERAGETLDLTELGKMQDPISSPPSEFLENQPLPRDGIICYMAAFSDHDY